MRGLASSCGAVFIVIRVSLMKAFENAGDLIEQTFNEGGFVDSS
jgi:hypothetical protein